MARNNYSYEKRQKDLAKKKKKEDKRQKKLSKGTTPEGESSNAEGGEQSDVVETTDTDETQLPQESEGQPETIDQPTDPS